MLLTSNLTKYYEAQPAVRDVSLFIPSGETCALIGPNGAGKTTLLKMLAGLLRPTSGRIEVAGIEAGTEPKRLHKIVGYVPDTFGLYDELTVHQFMDYFARAHGVAHELVERRIADVLALTRLEEKRDALTGSLSRGMRQRLVIAKTLLHAPKVLLLDEPASGLDPHARFDLRDLIRELAAMGTTLVVSSHILTELADFSTTVVIMERGRVVRAGNINELVREISNGIPVRIEALNVEAARKIAATLREREILRDINVEDAKIDGAFAGTRAELAQLHRLIVTEHDDIISFYERQMTIEDVFMAANSNRVA